MNQWRRGDPSREKHCFPRTLARVWRIKGSAALSGAEEGVSQSDLQYPDPDVLGAIDDLQDAAGRLGGDSTLLKYREGPESFIEITMAHPREPATVHHRPLDAAVEPVPR